MFQSRAFWIGFTLFALACGAGAYAYFPQAFPLVTLDLRMDRRTALADARKLAERHGWGPPRFRQAASFVLDERVQTYVELEAGGTAAFRRMLTERLYAPYTWEVRHFAEGETLETRVRFTPEGRPYGFRVKLPEDEQAKLPEGDTLIPGMPVDTFIRTQDRTPLAYLVSPLTDYFTRAFRS